MNLKEHTCCFFGHRKIVKTNELVNLLYTVIEDLIINKKINTFLFGSKSDFDKLCLCAITELKKKYHHIQRVYVRAEFPYINENYKTHLLEYYDDTYYPEHIKNSGRAIYIQRNYEMINHSKYCVIYFDKDYTPTKRSEKTSEKCNSTFKSGTKLAYDYARKKKREIINLLEKGNGDESN